MTQDELKQAVAKAAVDHIAPHLEPSSIVGVGTGSTANFFIDYLTFNDLFSRTFCRLAKNHFLYFDKLLVATFAHRQILESCILSQALN